MFTSAVRGIQFRPPEAQDVAYTLGVGETVKLEREPDNQYDPNAVRILYEDTFIGYVHKDVAQELSPALEEGKSFNAYVAGYDGRGTPIIEIVDGNAD